MVVFGRHLRGIVLEMSAPCESDVNVLGVAITVDFPYSGHLHRLPRRVVVAFLEEIGRTLVGISHPVEAPVALDREIIGRTVAVALQSRTAVLVSEERGMRRKSVNVVDRHVVPLLERGLNDLVRRFGCVYHARSHSRHSQCQ